MALIPNLPPFFNMNYTDKEGNLTPNSLLYNDLMWQILNSLVRAFNDNFTNIGLMVPNKTTAEITVLRDDVTVPVGTIWFNTNLAKLQVKTVAGVGSGTIETITST